MKWTKKHNFLKYKKLISHQRASDLSNSITRRTQLIILAPLHRDI